MNTLSKALSAALVMTALQGCSSLGVGKSEYACNGMPEGVRCMSTRDVYHSTNNGNIPSPTSVATDEKTDFDGQNPAIDRIEKTNAQYNDEVLKRNVVANLPYQPVPIRTPSMTMRIFVSPFEDVEGDLVVPGLVYTDVEQRRWVIGSPVQARKNTLRPLQMIQSPNAGNQNAAQ